MEPTPRKGLGAALGRAAGWAGRLAAGAAVGVGGGLVAGVLLSAVMAAAEGKVPLSLCGWAALGGAVLGAAAAVLPIPASLLGPAGYRVSDAAGRAKVSDGKLGDGDDGDGLPRPFGLDPVEVRRLGLIAGAAAAGIAAFVAAWRDHAAVGTLVRLAVAGQYALGAAVLGALVGGAGALVLSAALTAIRDE
jgi:hypothetical protein